MLRTFRAICTLLLAGLFAERRQAEAKLKSSNERLQDSNERLQLAGVVLCLYESGTKLAAEVAGDVEQFFKEARKGGRAWRHVRLFETRIRRNIRLAESPSFGQSIFDYAKGSHGAEDYLNLAREALGLSVVAAAAA